MKFAYSAGSGRGQTRERQRRDRASMPQLRERFPQYHALRLEFAFRDHGPFTPASQVTVLHPPAPAYFVFPCPYSDCDGEFDLSAAVLHMSGGESGRCAGQLHCSGHRHFDKRLRAPCALLLEFHVVAQPG